MNKTVVIPADAKRIKIRPLALGEKTGHHHSLVCDAMPIEDAVEMYEKYGQIFVRIKEEGVVLEHQEHKPSPVPPGDYVVRIQTEVTDWGSVPVLD
jgi:putative heme iron utilization protein